MVTLAQVNFFILTDTFNMCHPSYVLLDVNPDIIKVLLKLCGNMPYSGMETASKRAVFVPLLSLLLLFKEFKLQPR